LFRKHFYQRADRRKIQKADEKHRGLDEEVFIKKYTKEVIDPSARFYIKDLSNLIAEVHSDGHVICFNFSHALPTDYSKVSYQEKKYLKTLQLIRNVPNSMSWVTDLKIFNYNYNLIKSISIEQAERNNARYIDLRDFPKMRNRSRYHSGGYYYLFNTGGSKTAGRILARYIIEAYKFRFDGNSVIIREVHDA